MKHLRNERGAALVLTIMIITLILLFTLTLSYQVLNTTKQVSTMEENIDARSMAEMGVTYYQTLVEEHVADQEINSINKIKLPDIPAKKVIEGERTFEITHVDQNPLSENEIQIEFTSLGTSHGHTAEIEQSISITLE